MIIQAISCRQSSLQQEYVSDLYRNCYAAQEEVIGGFNEKSRTTPINDKSHLLNERILIKYRAIKMTIPNINVFMTIGFLSYFIFV